MSGIARDAAPKPQRSALLEEYVSRFPNVVPDVLPCASDSDHERLPGKSFKCTWTSPPENSPERSADHAFCTTMLSSIAAGNRSIGTTRLFASGLTTRTPSTSVEL